MIRLSLTLCLMTYLTCMMYLRLTFRLIIYFSPFPLSPLRPQDLHCIDTYWTIIHSQGYLEIILSHIKPCCRKFFCLRNPYKFKYYPEYLYKDSSLILSKQQQKSVNLSGFQCRAEGYTCQICDRDRFSGRFLLEVFRWTRKNVGRIQPKVWPSILFTIPLLSE